MRSTITMIEDGTNGAGDLIIVASWAADDWLEVRGGYTSPSQVIPRKTNITRNMVCRWGLTAATSPGNFPPDGNSLLQVGDYNVSSSVPLIRGDDLTESLAYPGVVLHVPLDLMSGGQLFSGAQSQPIVYPLCLPLTWDSGISVDLLDYFRELPTHLLIYGNGAAFVVVDAGASDYHPDITDVLLAGVGHSPGSDAADIGLPRLEGPDGSYGGVAKGAALILEGGPNEIVFGSPWFEDAAQVYIRSDTATEVGTGPRMLGWMPQYGTTDYLEGPAAKQDWLIYYEIYSSMAPPTEPTGPIVVTIRYYSIHGEEVGTQTISMTLNTISAFAEYSASSITTLDPPAESWAWRAEIPQTVPDGYAIYAYGKLQGRCVPLPFLSHDADGAMVGPARMIELPEAP